MVAVASTGNRSVAPNSSLTLTVTVFDGSQNVIAAGYADVTPDELAPGESADFEIDLPEIGGSPENYIVNFQGVP